MTAIGRKRMSTALANGEGMAAEVPAHVLESLTRVGPEKAVGYLPLSTVQNLLELDVDDVIAGAIARGLKALRLEEGDCCVRSGALYLYDPAALERVLGLAETTLMELGFPIDAEGFVRAIARDWLPYDHPAVPIIRAAFADPWRPEWLRAGEFPVPR